MTKPTLLKYSLKCEYYDKSFDTMEELLQDITETGMDPNYNITIMGWVSREKAIDLIQF